VDLHSVRLDKAFTVLNTVKNYQRTEINHEKRTSRLVADHGVFEGPKTRRRGGKGT